MRSSAGLLTIVFTVLQLSWIVHAQNFWMEDIPRRGKVTFQPNEDYPVFRNVKDFGAKGKSFCVWEDLSSDKTQVMASQTIQPLSTTLLRFLEC